MVGGELDLKSLLLDSLPDLPAGLTALDVRGNRLMHLPKLPESLVKLLAAHNSLEHLPELPRGLTELYLRNNRLFELPALPAGLEGLVAYGNQLTELPTLPVSLRMLNVSSNRLTHLPSRVFSMPYEVRVNAEGNSFSLAFLQQAHQAMLAPDYNGPQLCLGKAFHSVDGAVRDWLSNDEQAQIRRWQAHSLEVDAAGFARFLVRLKAGVDDNAEFKAGVAKWLTKLSQDDELRQLTFEAAQGATAACNDRVALTYNDLTKLSHAHAVSRGDYDNRLVEIVESGRGAFRLDALEKIARKKAQAARQNHEIEVYLAYQVKLRDRLHLPTGIADMLYFNYSTVTPQDLESAEQEVLARERLEFPQYFLVEWEPWQQVLARLDPDGFERAHQKLQDMLADYDRELSAYLASLGLPEDLETQAQAGVGLMKTLQLAVYEELTRELLRKRGEEALMDQIYG
ncbi:NEL-type E3 ubiquitin ligase domain-containing protein [Pandoraea pulmonicola]|nr:NEL-type E3 ubiquitin ligase domain-containing protein [Pandoraea pulmonicola]SUA88602.1 Probable E3 ubiquitin-protein ligase ipaH7.8 [Pandoraea pulmonicola]